MKNFIKKITGIAALEEAKSQLVSEAIRIKEQAEAQAAEAQERADAAHRAAADAIEAERVAKMTAKERATAKNEPYVSVVDTKVNADNPRNGFFELDWNDLFITQLKYHGYGFDGDPEEEIVDRWFRELARNMLGEEGITDMRGAGYINVASLGQGKAEIS